jgi:hypothetical protein
MRLFKQRWLLLLLTSGLYVYGVWSLGTASSFHACVQSETKAAAQEAKKGFPPSPLPIIDRTVFAGRCALHEMYAYRDLIAAVATVLIAIFTFTLWQSTKRLWEAGEKQLRIGRQQTFANIHAAKAAKRSAEIAEDALVASTRPWVGVDQVGINSGLKSPGQITVDVFIKNTGNSPALKMRGQFNGHVAPNTQPPPPIPASTDERISGSVLFPNGDFHFWPFTGSPPLNQATVDAIANGTALVWIAGRIDCDDRAGEPHFTTVRMQYHPDTNGFGTWRDGNEAE